MASVTAMPVASAGIASPQVVNGLKVNPRTPRQQRYINILKWLGIAEVSLGSFCLIVGAIALGYIQVSSRYYISYNYYYRYGISIRAFSIGEGIWCGAWIIVAGGLGIGVAKKGSTPCLIIVHLAFSIVGAVFAGVLVILSSIWASTSYGTGYYLGLSITVAVVAFIAMVLQITSAVYCCFANHGCCNGCDTSCCPIEQPEMRYVINTTQMSGQGQTVFPQIQNYATVVQPQTQQAFYLVPHPQSQPPQQQQQQQRQQQTMEKGDFQSTNEDNDNTLPMYENAVVLENNFETLPEV